MRIGIQRRSAIKTEVTFWSAKFPPYEGEEERINPGLWGQRLAECLSRSLPKHGVEVGDPIAEDWGWVVPIKNKRFNMWIGCGHHADADDAMGCFIKPHKPRVWRLFGRIDTTADITRVADALDKILRAAPDIREITWSLAGQS